MQSEGYSGSTRKLVKTRHPGIFKRGDRYVVVFRANGRQRKQAAKTLAEARSLQAQSKADVVRGEFREASKLTFEQYAGEWLASYAGRTAGGVRPDTVAQYKRTLEREAFSVFGSRRLAAIEARHVKKFTADLSARGLSPASVRAAVAPVKALLATAHEEGIIRSNPAAGVRVSSPRVDAELEQERAKALTPEELRRFLAEIPAEWRTFFTFMAHTGVRVSEALAVEWRDVSFGARPTVNVCRRLYKGALGPPKSKHGRRAIPLSRGLSRALWQLRASHRPKEVEPVFSRAGQHLNPATIRSTVLRPAARRAGVEGMGFHTLRHTAITNLLRNGANAKQAQVWAGHHSPAFTLAVYCHLLPEDMPDPDFLDSLTGAEGGNRGATRASETGRDEAAEAVAAYAG